MANPVATVAFIDGQAWAKSPDGSLRELSLGDLLNADEVLITAEGARVELDFGDNQTVAIAGGQDVGMGPDLWEVSVTDPSEAALVDASVQEALTILEQGGDLLAELEETAAGGGDSGDGGGNSFVQLGRVNPEAVESQEYAFGEPSFTRSSGTQDSAGVINRAPTIENLSLSVDEDSQVTGQVLANDTESDSLTYVIATPAANGTVTLNPVTGEFTYEPNANYFGADSFTVTVSDPRGGSATSTVMLDIVSVNDVPTTSNLSLATDEDTPVSGQVVAADVDGDTLTYNVTTAAANGTVSLDAATGEFIYTPNANYYGGDSFVVTVNDGQGGTVTSTISVNIAPVNDTPVASNQSLSTEENTPIDGQVVASDVDGDMLSYVVTTAAVNGSVSLDVVTGEFTYTPNANYNGSDSFVVTVSDGNGGTTTSSINIGITPVNDAPVTADINLTTDEDTPIDGQVVASDVDGDTLSYIITTAAANGSVSLDADTGEFTYTPNANYNGSDLFIVAVSDGNGGTTTSTITLGVTPVNDTPVTADVNLITQEDTPVNGQVVAADVDGDTLTYNVTTAAANGTVSLDAATGEFIYTPNANYYGGDSFVVTVNDGQGGTVTSTISVNIAPVNDAPVASNQNLSTEENTPIDGQVVASDVDGDMLSYVVTTAAVNGSVSIDAVTGEFTYTPNANYNGSDSFVVTVSDGNGGTTTSSINIGITPVNDAPVTADVNLTTDEDTPIDGQVIASDADGDTLSYLVTTAAANGSVSLDVVTGEFTYTPNTNYNGSDSFVVTVSDGNGGATTSTITLDITPLNDAPVTADINLTTDEDTPIDGQVVASDVDGDTLSYLVTTAAANGSVSLDTVTGEFTYTPNPNYNGSDVFVVTVSDGNGGTTTSTVAIGVTPINDAPVTTDINLTTDEDTPIDGQVVASDIDGDALSYLVTTAAVNGSVSLDAATGEFIYTPNANYYGSDSFVVTVSDGNGGTATSTVTIGVTPVNDAPVTANINLTTDEDTPIDGQVIASDVDGDTLSYLVTTAAANGSVSLDAVTGEFTYTPNTNYNGSDSFIVTVSDGNGGTTTSSVTIGITPVNDAPVTANINLTTDEDTPIDGQVIASDVDGDTLSYLVTTAAANGSVSLDTATGEFTYTPNTNYNGSDSFVVTVSDGNGGTTTSTVAIGVTQINDAPVTADVNLTTDEDTPIDGQVIASDADGDALSYLVTTAAANGSVSLDAATGEFTYTPNANYNGSDSFVVTVNDGNGGTTTSTVTIGVTPVNDAPVATDINFTTDEDTPIDGQVVASDVDGDTLSYIITTAAANGSVSLDADTGEFTYTPNANYNGSDSFIVTVSDGNGGVVTSTVNIGVNPVADAPTLSVDSQIETGATPVDAVPPGLGLTQEYYQASALAAEGLLPNIRGVTTEAMVAGMTSATPNPATVISSVFLPSITVGSGYHFTGYLYLQAGQTYQLMGSRDDTLLVKIGGETVYDAGLNQWGEINDQVRTGNTAGSAQIFTAQENGYYSIDIMVFNSDGLGDLSLGLSVDGAPMLALNTDNFNLYANAAAIIASGGVDDFIANADGGYYPEGGTEDYTYFNLNIAAGVNAVGEVLSIEVADIPVGAVLTDGTNIFTSGAGTTFADVSGWDLANLKLVPETGYTGSFALTVTATSTDGVSTADATEVINLEVVANDTNNIVGSGILTGSDVADLLIGLNGDDQLTGGAESDVLVGGQGNDILVGGLGADTFKWSLGDAADVGAPAQDVVTDFNVSQNDVLDLADLLQGEDSDSLTEFLHITTDGTDTTVHISSQGGFIGGVYDASATDQMILLQNVNLTGTDSADMINQLKAASNLLTD